MLEVTGLRLVPGTSPSFPDRVLTRIDATASCWEWTGTKDAAGYGVLGRGARGTGNIAAHRAVWELLVGPIPAGLHFDHLCRNRGCVNPDHGELVTPDENKRRGFGPASLHRLRSTCPQGHPKDGVTRPRKGKPHRYCKTCARARSAAGRNTRKAS